MHWYNNPQWWAAIGTIFLGLTAIGVPLVSGFIKSVFLKPTIEVIQPSIVKQTESLYIIRVLLKNKGRKIARRVEANLEKITDPDGKVRENFISLPLHWTHDWLKRTERLTRDIYINQYCYLDLAEVVRKCEDEIELKLKVQAGQEISKWSRLNKGVSKLQIMFFEESGYTLRKKIEIDWDGTFNKPKVRII